jgi:hypothetical protein
MQNIEIVLGSLFYLTLYLDIVGFLFEEILIVSPFSRSSLINYIIMSITIDKNRHSVYNVVIARFL